MLDSKDATKVREWNMMNGTGVNQDAGVEQHLDDCVASTRAQKRSKGRPKIRGTEQPNTTHNEARASTRQDDCMQLH